MQLGAASPKKTTQTQAPSPTSCHFTALKKKNTLRRRGALAKITRRHNVENLLPSTLAFQTGDDRGMTFFSNKCNKWRVGVMKGWLSFPRYFACWKIEVFWRCDLIFYVAVTDVLGVKHFDDSEFHECVDTGNSVVSPIIVPHLTL